MIRAFLYGTGVAAMVACRGPIGGFVAWPWIVFLTLPGVLLVVPPLGPILRALRLRLLPSLAAGAVAGMTCLFVTGALLGWPGSPWTHPSWIPWIPEAVAGGAAAAWGRLQNLRTED